MIPTFFGTKQKRLFGVYHPARIRKANSGAVLICYPWGHEYFAAHRSLTKLAENLASAGCHVFRFDYFGTGDSGGEAEDGSIAQWMNDLETAETELMDMSGAEKISLVGLRFGAYLAAQRAAQKPGSIRQLVLWDPVVSGEEYVASLFQAAANMPIGAKPPPKRPAALGGGHEICGVPLTDAMEAEMRSLELPPLLSGTRTPTLAIESMALHSHARLRQALQDRPQPTELEHIDCRAAWREDWPNNAGVVPVKALQRIGEWLT